MKAFLLTFLIAVIFEVVFIWTLRTYGAPEWAYRSLPIIVFLLVFPYAYVIRDYFTD